MKKLLLLTFIFINSILSQAQITFISPFTGNQGGGTPLFGEYVPSGNGDMFLDWETFGSATTGAGQGSQCRVIVRGMAEIGDSQTVVASDIICTVNGIYSTENGNNDVYFVNLNTCNLPDGRYSVEIQCDEPANDYDNTTGGSTAATTWGYNSPAAYYLGAAGSCSQFDPLDNITEIGSGGVAGVPQLDYFNVGDADVYRTMVVFNGLFLDMGKFQPGNPTLPSSLNDLQNLYDPACVGIGQFPTGGFCGNDQLILSGAEVNVTKKTDCGTGNVTANRFFYRIYFSGDTPPAFRSESIAFNDDCPPGYPGAGTAFPTGGNCQNQNNILDQRWQSTDFDIDLLALAPLAGTYNIDIYTETDVVNCSGVTSTVQEPADGSFYTTSFVRNDHLSATCGGGGACDGDAYEFADMVSIFASNNCTGCHGGSGGLNLSNYNNVTTGGNRGAGGCGPYPTPLDFLIGKVDGSLVGGIGCGSAMRNGIGFGNNGMSAFDIAAIRSWVDNGAPETCAVLPVELVDFQAKMKNEQILLSWQTASESNTSHFLVERSVDGRNFYPIGAKQAAGNSNTLLSYELADENPRFGNNYYRLKILDEDQTFSFSQIKLVKFETTGIHLSINPTITNNYVSIELGQPILEDTPIFIHDITGRLVMENTIEKGNHNLGLKVESLPAGTYFVSISAENKRMVKKMIVTKR